MTGIINYGLGNLGSIQNMLRVIGEKSIVSSNIEELNTCDRYILPGVGAFDAGMSKLNERGLTSFITKEIPNKNKALLGICLGMQLLGRKSEEGHLSGLALIPFDNTRFSFKDEQLKIPHMGWDVVNMEQDIPLLKGISGRQRYYFVHSYHARCDSQEHVLMSCDYGYEFPAAVIKGNIMGVQFHPEKSHDFGMRLLNNYVKEY